MDFNMIWRQSESRFRRTRYKWLDVVNDAVEISIYPSRKTVPRTSQFSRRPQNIELRVQIFTALRHWRSRQYGSYSCVLGYFKQGRCPRAAPESLDPVRFVHDEHGSEPITQINQA